MSSIPPSSSIEFSLLNIGSPSSEVEEKETTDEDESNSPAEKKRTFYGLAIMVIFMTGAAATAITFAIKNSYLYNPDPDKITSSSSTGSNHIPTRFIHNLTDSNQSSSTLKSTNVTGHILSLGATKAASRPMTTEMENRQAWSSLANSSNIHIK